MKALYYSWRGERVWIWTQNGVLIQYKVRLTEEE